MTQQRGLGKCSEHHVSSYGFPTRPEEPFPFCSQCGKPMVWVCPECQEALPEDVDELAVARFCRHCGGAYFHEAPGADPGR